MNKGVIIGIIFAGVILGILGFLSLEIFSNKEDSDLSSEPILGNEVEGSGLEEKPLGRNLSIELDEKMGLSAP